MAEAATIHCERGGDDGPTLVLLHGMTGTGAVWDDLLPLLGQDWPGRWLVPDLRGHGRSFHRAPYGIGMHAADVAALLEPDAEVTLVGHSMGGAVAIALATGLFGVPVRRVVAFGVKMDWSEAEIARAAALAAAPARLFETRDEAIERYLRVAGLAGLVAPGARAAALGVRAQDGKYRLANDPRINAVGHTDLAAIARAARAPLHLLSGEHDGIGDAAGMARLGGEVTVLPGLGHSPHVEAPAQFWQAIAGWLAGDAAPSTTP